MNATQLKIKATQASFRATYVGGQQSEAQVIAAMQANGFPVTKSTKEQDMFQDIDCFLGNLAISIKTSHATQNSGNLCFELEQCVTATGEWIKAWFYNGEASVGA